MILDNYRSISKVVRGGYRYNTSSHSAYYPLPWRVSGSTGRYTNMVGSPSTMSWRYMNNSSYMTIPGSWYTCNSYDSTNALWFNRGYGCDLGVAACSLILAKSTGMAPFVYAYNYNASSMSVNYEPSISTPMTWDVVIGTSQVNVTNADYQLNARITSGSLVQSVARDSNSTSFTLTYQNTSSASVTVREIGLVAHPYYTNTGNIFVTSVVSSMTEEYNGMTVLGDVLVYRAVLDSAITVAPGEGAVFTIKWTDGN